MRETCGIPRLKERCSSSNTPHFRAISRGPETQSPTRKVDGGVRRFARTRLRDRIPVNREVFRVFRVSEGAFHKSAARESQARRQFVARETHISVGPNRERNRDVTERDQGSRGYRLANLAKSE